MKQKRVKKIGSFLLVGAIVLMLFPTFHTEVHAAGNELPAKEQFATVEELKKFNTNNSDGETNPAKVYFGKDSQQWWIAGSQGDKELTLFATSPPSATEQQFEPIWDQNKTYNDDWECTYESNPTSVYPNHYGASPLRKTLQELEKSHFSDEEQKLMNDTIIYTDDTKNGSTYSTTNKLYLAYGNVNEEYVTVGENASGDLNNGLHIDKAYWENSEFWLRAPSKTGGTYGLDAYWRGIANTPVRFTYVLMPAFELDLSSVIFASAASAASSDGSLSVNDAFTLRHQSQADIGIATISQSHQSAAVADVKNENTYLVVQNKEGAWSKKVSSNDLVFASDMDSSLTSFENCKVWLEATSENITYAEEATQGSGHNVKVNVGENLTINGGNTLQTNVSGNITEITIKAKNGYFLPDDYIDGIQGLNGLSVTETKNGFTISGTPKSDVNITLPAATKKVYNMTVTGSGTFTTVCKDYQPIAANEFIITNNGNSDLENVNVSLTGTDADKFELSENKVTTIQPNETTKVTVKPNDGSGVGTYQAKLSVAADNVTEQSIDLQFTVSEHDYNAVVTSPTCTEKGYTTYTCKNCNHSYVGDEVAAKGHTFGKWEIITSPTCEQGGSRKHTCEDCGYVETENLDPTGHDWETEYTVDKEPTCTEDGSKSIHCKNCDAVKDSTTIAKSGHSFTNYVSNNDATCTEDGTKTAKCDRCDETDTRVQENSALGHDLGEWKVIKDAAATETGIKERHCARCDYKETESIPVSSKSAQPNDNNSDKDNSNSDTNKESPETGDQTNAGLFTALLSMSAFGIAILTVLKKKKALEHK